MGECHGEGVPAGVCSWGNQRKGKKKNFGCFPKLSKGRNDIQLEGRGKKKILHFETTEESK